MNDLLRYQRPTMLKEGTIKQANELVAKLGSEGALARRFAKLEEVLPFAVWPRIKTMIVRDGDELLKDESLLAEMWRLYDDGGAETAKAKRGGAFDHLLPNKDSAIKPVELPPKQMGWTKFRTTILPQVAAIQLMVPMGENGFYGLVTAADPNAPPILQWDGLAGGVDELGMSSSKLPLPRNPFSWYFYHGGSPAHRWGLVAGLWTKVTAILPKPCHWQQPDKFKHHNEGAFFVLDGCVDQNPEPHGGLFPEMLRTEYHGIRSALEAYTKKAVVAGREQGTANGLALDQGSTHALVTLKVAKIDGSEETFHVHWRNDE